MTSKLTYIAASPADTDLFGQRLASALPSKATVALCGTLGAGKTRLVQAVAVACGMSRDDVTSPTFVICQHYHAPRVTIHHLDAYRVKDEDEWFEIGVDELFEQPGWTFVEWADRFLPCLPDEYLRIDIEVTGEQQRAFFVQAIGGAMSAVVASLRTALTG
jgi:tRNA threonylcarbamoyladenosine biosynthesis protein TsaE